MEQKIDWNRFDWFTKWSFSNGTLFLFRQSDSMGYTFQVYKKTSEPFDILYANTKFSVSIIQRYNTFSIHRHIRNLFLIFMYNITERKNIS